MLSIKNSKPELSDAKYVPIMKGCETYYGGSQMWFPAERKNSKDYLIHNYGCGTIATADFFLYLALHDRVLQSPETEIALRGGNCVYFENYNTYIHIINEQYTKTKRYIAVLGTKIAEAINDYSNSYDLGFQAFWMIGLTYYDMLDIIEDMLLHDFPVILSIGPNTPKLWGKKGIILYTLREFDYKDDTSESTEQSQNAEKDVPEADKKKTVTKKPYYYKVAVSDVNCHYITVTGVIKDNVANRIMLRISSWGKQYYINYEEYRDYVDNIGGTLTSSIVRVTRD